MGGGEGGRGVYGVGAKVYGVGARVYGSGARVYAAGARVYDSLVEGGQSGPGHHH